MQIVIDIPEEIHFCIIKDCYFFDNETNIIRQAIKNGTLLPKRHGRLIDADALKLTRHDIHVEEINYLHRCVSIENIDNAPTIIEADTNKEDNI